MVGADLLERFRRAGLEAAGQRRNVTVLFADISGYTHLSEQMDSEDLYDLVQKFISILADDVYKYEGMVDKFTGDGLMALFGAPIAHENNAELAVRSAVDMLADVSRLALEMRERVGADIHVHIGLHTGSVIVGGIGSDMLMNYTAIGDTVNLAQRLDSVAGPGVILASEAVQQQTKALFDFEAVPNLTLKGFLKPVTAYEVLREKAKPGSVRGLEGLRAPMIGREVELKQLTQAVGALVTYRQGQMVMITGEAGMGKTRLVGELKALIAQVPVQILEGFSLTYRRSVSYWIFQEVFRHYLGVTPDTPGARVGELLTQRVTHALGARAAEVLPYLEHMLSITPSDVSSARKLDYLDAGQLRQQIFLAVRDLLVAESRLQPIVIVLEDLHWGDEASLDLLYFLLDSLPPNPILILAISRPFDSGPLGKIATRAENVLENDFTLLRLHSLSPQHSTELLQQLLAIPNLPKVLREQIIQRSAGIPLYLEEILRMLIDAGILLRIDHHWELADSADVATLGVPETLQGLILARFDRLSPQERRVLQVAAIIGRQFSWPVLQAVLDPMEEAEVRATLLRLIEREFVLPPTDTAGLDYSFKHMMVSDAIYGTLLKRDQTEIHGRVAEAIEQVYADRLDEQIDLLARHFSWSARKDRALHYQILAGQRSARSYINELTRQYFEDALALLPQVKHSPYQRFQVHSGLGDVLALLGEYQTGREHFQSAFEAIADDFNSYIEEQCGLQRKISSTFERQGNYEQALLCLAQAQHILSLTSTPMLFEKAQILNDIGWIHFRRGNLEDAEQYLGAALNLCKDTTRYDVIASVYNRLGGVCYQKGQLDQASTYVRKSLVFREEIGDIVGVARSFNNLGLLGWRKGDWDRALEDFSRSLDLNANLGDVEGLVHLHSNIGLLLTDRGRMDEARHHLEESLKSAQKIGHSYLEGLAYMHLSRYWLAMCEWEKSLDYSNRSLAVFTALGSAENSLDLYASIGEAYLGMGQIEKAHAACETAHTLLREQTPDSEPGPSLEQGRILRLAGNIARVRGNFERAAEALRNSADQFAAMDNHLELGRTSVALALLAIARNDQIGARVHVNEARLIFRQLRADVDLKQLEQMDN